MESKNVQRKKTLDKGPHSTIREGNQDFGRPNINLRTKKNWSKIKLHNLLSLKDNALKCHTIPQGHEIVTGVDWKSILKILF
jgi:hypothetical protein